MRWKLYTKMKYKRTLLFVVALEFGALAQEPPRRDVPLQIVSSWLNEWPRRANQLRNLSPVTISSAPDSLKLDLISWLDTDSDYARRYAQLTGRSLGEGFGDYYVNLAVLVAGMRDQRAVSPLAKAIQVGNVISDALLEFGDAGVDSLVAELHHPDMRVSVILALGRFVEARQSGRMVMSEANARRIEDILLQSANDQSGPVRMAAVRALGQFKPDEQIVRILTRIAESDSFEITRAGQGGASEKVYPVRSTAAEELQKLRRRK
jgi:HEAT repeat protein